MPTSNPDRPFQVGEVVLVKIDGESERLGRVVSCPPPPDRTRLRGIGGTTHLLEICPRNSHPGISILAYESELEHPPSYTAGELLWDLLET